MVVRLFWIVIYSAFLAFVRRRRKKHHTVHSFCSFLIGLFDFSPICKMEIVHIFQITRKGVGRNVF